MSVTELDPLFRALHANGAAATAVEPPPPTPVSEPAAALVTAPGDDTVTPPAPDLDQPEPAPQHDPDLQPADLNHDPLTVEDDDAEELGGFEAVTDSEPDFEDDEPVATVEVLYDDEPEQLEIPTPAAPPTTVAAPVAPAPAAGGVFAAFTPEIPQPRREPASAAAPVTEPVSEQPRNHASSRKLRLPSAGALLPSTGRLAPHLRRPKKRTIIALGLLALVVIAAAMGGPNKTPAPPASKPPAAVSAARPGTPTKPSAPKARKAAKRPTYRAASRQRPRTRVRTRVVIRRVAVPAPAATGAPARAGAPSSASVRRAPAAPAAAAASEFRP
jgi:hypothetical protein